MKYLNKEINGIALSRIGLGAMRMADVQQGVDTIHAALDSGITYLNTGDFYGHGESELVIREALKTRKREELFISVKFGGMLTPDDRFYGIDVRPQSVQNYLAYTLKRLGTDYVDLVPTRPYQSAYSGGRDHRSRCRSGQGRLRSSYWNY